MMEGIYHGQNGPGQLEIVDEGSVRVLGFNRPERRNALTVELALLLADAITAAETDVGVRAVVITGIGGHFSAGGDVGSILSAIDGPEGSGLEMMATFHKAILAIWNSPLPVIAAVSGVIYGGALNLALACDLIVCSADARLCEVFLRRGVIPDLGGAYLLPRIVGLQRAKELMFFTREIDAQTAYAMGLVNQVVEEGGSSSTLEEAVAWGSRLAGVSPTALALTKQLTNQASGEFETFLGKEALAQASVFSTAEARDGMLSFL